MGCGGEFLLITCRRVLKGVPPGSDHPEDGQTGPDETSRPLSGPLSPTFDDSHLTYGVTFLPVTTLSVSR